MKPGSQKDNLLNLPDLSRQVLTSAACGATFFLDFPDFNLKLCVFDDFLHPPKECQGELKEEAVVLGMVAQLTFFSVCGFARTWVLLVASKALLSGF